MSRETRPFSALRLALLMTTAIALDPTPGRAGPPPLTDERRWIGTAPLLLLSRPDVRAEVGLDATQAADADRALHELYEQALALKRGELALSMSRRGVVAVSLNGTAREAAE